MKRAMVESCEEPASNASAMMIISIAGSANAAIITSRDDPIPPNAVPMSIPARVSRKRAAPSRAMMAIRSPVQEKIRPVAKVGTSAAATQVKAKIR